MVATLILSTSNTFFGTTPALVALAVVLGSVLYWDAQNRSMETAKLWGVVIAGLCLTSAVAGLLAVAGYLASRPS